MIEDAGRAPPVSLIISIDYNYVGLFPDKFPAGSISSSLIEHPKQEYRAGYTKIMHGFVVKVPFLAGGDAGMATFHHAPCVQLQAHT